MQKKKKIHCIFLMPSLIITKDNRRFIEGRRPKTRTLTHAKL